MDISGDIAAAALDSFEDSAAVLDADGVILGTNASWNDLGTRGGRPVPVSDVGVNYLDTCRDGGDYADRAAESINAILDGATETFRMEYPCHSPDRKQWFLMRADRFTVDDAAYALVTHTDVTERVAAELAANRRAERTLAVASYISHDLRNPLTIARGWLETVMDGGDPADLERVERALKRMDDMIGGAVDLLRVERDGIQKEPVDLDAVARSAWEFHAHAADTNAELVVADATELDASPELLDRLLANLFANARQHAGDDVTVTVGTMAADTPRADASARIGFYVEDDGPGIPVEQRQRVFEVGFTTVRGSTGLGLAFVREVAELHGWSVTVTESASGGARFEFRVRPETPRHETREIPE